MKKKSTINKHGTLSREYERVQLLKVRFFKDLNVTKSCDSSIITVIMLINTK